MSLQKERLEDLIIEARSAALHLGILKNHLLVRFNNNKYEILMIIPGQKNPERYVNMSYVECIIFLKALKVASKVVKQVQKENTNFINRHIEVIKG